MIGRLGSGVTTRRPVRAALGVLASTSLACFVVLSASAPAARADTPQQRAAALAAAVRTLTRQAETATERYNAIEAELGRVVTLASLSEEAADDAHAVNRVQQDAAAARARQLYMMGGPGPLLVQVLTHSTDLSSLQTGLITTRNVVDRSRAAATAAAHVSDAATAAANRAAALEARQTALEAQAQSTADEITATLGRTQAALDSATAEVRALAAQQEAARAAADSAAFDAALATATLTANPAAAGASSPMAARALEVALSLQGKPYQWGGNGPDSYDCSGMTKAAYAAAGLVLPRTADAQYYTGPHPSLAQLLPGDLLFWATDPADPATIHHVAIYAGHGLMVSANHTGDVVRLQPVWWSEYAGATRPGGSLAPATQVPVTGSGGVPMVVGAGR